MDRSRQEVQTKDITLKMVTIIYSNILHSRKHYGPKNQKHVNTAPVHYSLMSAGTHILLRKIRGQAQIVLAVTVQVN